MGSTRFFFFVAHLFCMESTHPRRFVAICVSHRTHTHTQTQTHKDQDMGHESFGVMSFVFLTKNIHVRRSPVD